ncbi:MAG: hypothetical protein IJ213_07245 [Bacteroidales bacterium]|nr:hypothetical protein [Bacteroidales bacterium]
MIQFTELDFLETQNLVRRFAFQKKMFSNYFMNDLKGMMSFHTDGTLLLKKNYVNFCRIYFISDNKSELIKLFSELNNTDAINIPTKKDIDEDMLEILKAGGYKSLTVYERLYKNTNEARGEFEESFAKPEDVDTIMSLLLEQLFNPISDRIPSREEILDSIYKKQVLVNRDTEDNVNGVLIFSIEGKKCNFLEWASTASAGESLFLFYNAFNLMNEKGIERSTIWVRSDNLRPKKIYQSWGYQPDGLKDYTFVKYANNNVITVKRCDDSISRHKFS